MIPKFPNHQTKVSKEPPLIEAKPKEAQPVGPSGNIVSAVPGYFQQLRDTHGNPLIIANRYQVARGSISKKYHDLYECPIAICDTDRKEVPQRLFEKRSDNEVIVELLDKKDETRFICIPAEILEPVSSQDKNVDLRHFGALEDFPCETCPIKIPVSGLRKVVAVKAIRDFIDSDGGREAASVIETGSVLLILTGQDGSKIVLWSDAPDFGQRMTSFHPLLSSVVGKALREPIILDYQQI